MIYHLPTFNHFWNLTDFRNFWPRVTFVDLVIPFFEKLTPRASVWYIFYHILPKFEIWPFLGIFDLGWPFLNSGDLWWPRDPFFWKADVTSVILIYDLPTLNEVWNLTFFRNLCPLMSFGDLVIPFFERLTSRASVWYICYHILSKFEIWPFLGIFDLGWPFFDLDWPFFRKLTPRLSFWYIVYHILSKFEIWPFFGIFDLGWPFLTSGDLFSESWRRDRHFDI